MMACCLLSVSSKTSCGWLIGINFFTHYLLSSVPSPIPLPAGFSCLLMAFRLSDPMKHVHTQKLSALLADTWHGDEPLLCYSVFWRWRCAWWCGHTALCASGASLVCVPLSLTCMGPFQEHLVHLEVGLVCTFYQIILGDFYSTPMVVKKWIEGLSDHS